MPDKCLSLGRLRNMKNGHCGGSYLHGPDGSVMPRVSPDAPVSPAEFFYNEN